MSILVIFNSVSGAGLLTLQVVQLVLASMPPFSLVSRPLIMKGLLRTVPSFEPVYFELMTTRVHGLKCWDVATLHWKRGDVSRYDSRASSLVTLVISAGASVCRETKSKAVNTGH